MDESAWECAGMRKSAEGCMKVHFHHGRALGRTRVHCRDESALGYIRVHLDNGSALGCMSALGSWECTGMLESALW